MEAELSGPNTEPRRGRPPLGLLGMLALVAGVELAVAGLRLDLASPLSEDWRFASWAAGHRACESQALFLGDSLVKYALLPKVVEARSGIRSYNLANAAATIPSTFFVFRQAIEAGVRPKAVVVDFAALQLPDPDPPHIRCFPELATLRDCLDLAEASGSPDFLATAVLSKLLPTYKWRFEIRSAVVAALDGRSVSPRAITPICQKMWSDERGAQPMPPAPNHGAAEEYNIQGVTPKAWACEPRNERYIDRFAELAAAHGVTVFWLLPPLAPEVHNRRVYFGTEEAYGRFARAKAAQHKNLVILDARRAGYDDSVHLDHLHLDNHGATVLSGDIASVLVDRIIGQVDDRWIDLPAYAGRTGLESPRAVAYAKGPAGTRR